MADKLTDLSQIEFQEDPQDLQDISGLELETVDVSGMDLQDVESQPLNTETGAQEPTPGAKAPGDGEDTVLQNIFQGLGIGAQETVAPWSVTPEQMAERERERAREASWAQGISEFVGGMGIDIAAASAAAAAGAKIGGSIGGVATAPAGGAGAVPGAAIGGAVGLISYALYSGLGQEELASKRTGGEYKPLRAAARVGLALNPILRRTGTIGRAATKAGLGKAMDIGEKGLVRAARLGAQVAGETAVATDEFGADAGKMALLVSLGLHGLAFKNASGLAPHESIDAGRLAGTEEGVRVGQRAGDKLAELDGSELKWSPDKMDKPFAQYILKMDGKDVKDMPEWKMKKQAAKIMADSYDDQDAVYASYKWAEMLGEAVEEEAAIAAKKLYKGGAFKDVDVDPLSGINKKFMDGISVAEKQDAAFGNGAMRTISDAAQDRGVFENAKNKLVIMGKQAYAAQDKLGISDHEMGFLRAFLSEGKPAAYKAKISKFLDPDGNVHGKVKDAVELWSNAFDAAWWEIKKRNFAVNPVESYMPMQMLDRMELADSASEMISNISLYMDKMKSPNIKEWTKKSIMKKAKVNEELAENILGQIKALKYLGKKNGVDTKKLDFLKMQEIKNAIFDKSSNRRMGQSVTASFSREKPIPTKFREMNIRRVFNNYVNSSVKTAIMDESLQRIQAQAMAFERAGMKETASWWSNLAKDIQGIDRPGTAKSWMQDKYLKYQRTTHNMLQSDNNIVWAGGKAARAAGDALSAWQTMVYPAYLGLNTTAHLRNLVQNPAVTGGVIGGPYGHALVARTMMQGPMNIITAALPDGFKKTQLVEHLEKIGILAKGQAAEALTDDSSAFLRTMGKIGDITLKTYSLTDMANRIWAYVIGKNLAEDISLGVKSAMKALKRMGPSVRADLQEAGITTLEQMRNRQEEFGDIIGRYLVGRTQFHYGTEQKSEFLREMGPFFSMFTKWPVAITSDIVTTLQSDKNAMKKMGSLFQKYGTPTAALALAGSLADEDNFFKKWLIGDTLKWAPVMSAFDLSIFNNPMWDTAEGAAAIMAEVAKGSDADLEGLAKRGAEKVLRGGMPPLSSMINEWNRASKAAGGKRVSEEIVDEMFNVLD